MAWESRNGVGRYYTRSRRVNGRIIREYVGTGLLGELACEADASEKAKQALATAAFRVIQNRDAELDEKLDSFLGYAEYVAGGLLILAGHHQHKRGEWRQRREQKRGD